MEAIDYLSVSECVNWLTLLGVEKSLNHQKFEILSIFDIKIWLLLLISLIFLSIINMKFSNKQNSFLAIIISSINHIETLITRSGKKFENLFYLIQSSQKLSNLSYLIESFQSKFTKQLTFKQNAIFDLVVDITFIVCFI